MNEESSISLKLDQGERISDEEALYLYSEADLPSLRVWASQVRARFHHPLKATYLTMRIINHTNICVARCDYCAFYQLPKSAKGYILTTEQIFSKIDETIALGGDLIGFNGGFNPQLKLDYYLELFSQLNQRYKDKIEIYALTIAELMYIAKNSNVSYFEAASRLKECGVRWITGGGAEVLSNEFRKRHSPLKYTADEFMEAHQEVIRAEICSTGTMVIGFDESIEERIEHLRRVRELQDKTKGLTSMLSWTYKPYNSQLGGKEISHEDYLRHLAVCRIYLDNIKHIRTSVLTQNENALLGLQYGANDFDVPLEDEVTEKAGAKINRNIEEVLASCRANGFQPVRRKPFAGERG